MDLAYIEKLLQGIDKKLDDRFSSLDRRVAILEGRADHSDHQMETLTEILNRLTQDPTAVLGKTDTEVRISKDAVYHELTRAGIPRRQALRELAHNGSIRVEVEPPCTRRYTPNVRVGRGIRRCIVAVIQEVEP